jgi:hypothetical protein
MQNAEADWNRTIMTARLSIFGLPGPKLPKPSRFSSKRTFVASTGESSNKTWEIY